MTKGYVRIHRSVWECPSFPSEPFSRREAWLWLIAQAAWQPTQTRVWPVQGRAGVNITLQRGQTAHSERFLAETWGWDRSKVRRYVRDLVGDAMVTRDMAQGATVLTICKYDEYQDYHSESDPPSDAIMHTPATRPRPKVKESKELNELNKEGRKKDSAPNGASLFSGSDDPEPPKPSAPARQALVPLDDWPENYGEIFWTEYPPGRKSGKKAVVAKLAAIRKNREVSFSRLIDGLRRYVESRPEPKYTKGPLVWLNQGCWDDEYRTVIQRARELTMGDIARGDF